MSGPCTEIREHFATGTVEHGGSGDMDEFSWRPSSESFRNLKFSLNLESSGIRGFLFWSA